MENSKNIFERLQFHEIISKRTCYGLIWGGFFDQKPCVIKMIMLTSGLHYDKNDGIYRDGRKNNAKINKPSNFEKNDPNPFLHREFQHRRSMTHDAFLHEAKELTHLSQLSLAPRVYGYGICTQFDIHYGFIIMHRTDGCLKDVLVRRPLERQESHIVKEVIDTMHKKHGITHGDMKPSNIGVYLDERGRVKKACLFDCQKIKHKGKYSDEEFRKLIDKDWRIYFKHIVKNREKDSKEQSKWAPLMPFTGKPKGDRTKVKLGGFPL